MRVCPVLYPNENHLHSQLARYSIPLLRAPVRHQLPLLDKQSSSSLLKRAIEPNFLENDLSCPVIAQHQLLELN
jgi:hypothetical protein